MSQPVTDLLGDAIPQAVQWLPTEWEASNFMGLYCASCVNRTTDNDGCPVWDDADPVEWVITPDGPKCTKFEGAA
jgi:hypothetical protein